VVYAGINGLKMFYEFRGTPVPVKVPVVVTVCPGALRHRESHPPWNNNGASGKSSPAESPHAANRLANAYLAGGSAC
jgi:hypothetical protein